VGTVEDSVAVAVAQSIRGISLHLSGELAAARLELEAAIGPGTRSRHTTTIYLGFEGGILAGAILARNLWLQGHPGQALERARQTVEDASAMDHSLTLSIALIARLPGHSGDRPSITVIDRLITWQAASASSRHPVSSLAQRATLHGRRQPVMSGP
jgi:hypothetical protein